MTKPADDQPFEFNLDTVQAEIDLTPFRVHFDGRRFEFAHMQALDLWELVEPAEGGDPGSIKQMFHAALGDKQLAEFRKIPLPQFKVQALFKAWQKHCGIGPGESPGSAT